MCIWINEKEIRNILISILGAFIQAFGIYNIHSIAPVTEGGLPGVELLLQYWLDISPALSAMVLSSVCYFAGWRMFGKKFLIYSGVSAASYSIFYVILEQFPRVYPEIADLPLAAALIGALFIGIGAGLCIIVGGATAGDDAPELATLTGCRFFSLWCIMPLLWKNTGGSITWLTRRKKFPKSYKNKGIFSKQGKLWMSNTG